MTVQLEDARKRLILALDVPGLDEAKILLDKIQGKVGLVKVGLELFTACGPAAVQAVRERDIDVFLDLKLHDIPATVAGAVRSALALDVAMLTVHTGGSTAMLEAAAKEAAGKINVLGVTLLTSMGEDDLAPVCLTGNPSDIVSARATLAAKCGLGGIVCSPKEVSLVRAAVGPNISIITPGIRPAGASMGDQKRAATPKSAIADGSDYLVVGRPIRGAENPAAAADEIVKEIAEALSE
ncbi:MAG: orotidine-5'-phosphate decarboxylase [Deltaproteobacteria bacterium]|nr:orotidine-5'-phosphate decarboxylase [Deltaproteobacteria bacterium]MBN2674156.1 orotidine-5'-phosphate decarboxylase [Deltaproteobacteria bacterium]